FYRRISASGKIKFFDRLLFLDPQGRRGEIKAGVLPAPFHFTGAFASFAPLTLLDKLSIARAMLHIIQHQGQPPELHVAGGITMLEWLRLRRQTQGAIDRFWRVVLVSALDEELHRTDARFGVDVFWKAFLLNKNQTSPITGCHFWFDHIVNDEPFLTLLDTTTQWVFNKTALYGRPVGGFTEASGSEKNRQYLQLVISASYDLLQKSREEIIDLCLAEVRHALPKARDAQLLKATVIKEAAATFSPEPGVDRWRPAQTTKIPGLFLAGDWTQTGWPATMEGAVRSGYLAAEALLRTSGTPKTFLQPDLAPD